MPEKSPFSVAVKPDWEAFLACIMREKTPERVHHIELFLDGEVKDWLCQHYGLLDGLNPDDPAFTWQREIRIQRFMGFDYVRQGIEGIELPLNRIITSDTAEMARTDGRTYIDERKGPITNWDEFERYPWPDLSTINTRALEWYEKNLPDDMCIIGGGWSSHFAEYLTWLMGYETLCYALFDQRDLVQAINEKILAIFTRTMELMLEFPRVKLTWGSDDMGFKTGPMIGPNDLREFVLPGHKKMAAMSHQAGRPYLLHSCGNLFSIMDDLIHDVQIDGLHSYEDTITDVRNLKGTLGQEIALLGGIDVDFLCRASEEQIRQRVRETLDICMPGGGYCLGTGNSVTNYIPVKHYLAMVDEGRQWKP